MIYYASQSRFIFECVLFQVARIFQVNHVVGDPHHNGVDHEEHVPKVHVFPCVGLNEKKVERILIEPK